LVLGERLTRVILSEARDLLLLCGSQFLGAPISRLAE
jgi:hypothetical protein